MRTKYTLLVFALIFIVTGISALNVVSAQSRHNTTSDTPFAQTRNVSSIAEWVDSTSRRYYSVKKIADGSNVCYVITSVSTINSLGSITGPAISCVRN